MSSVRDQIFAFFKGKGLSDAQVYGILGNARIESSLNPGAVNGNEGAIGIFQWEGGRRTALQHYAANHGGHESDLAMQLGYAWHELTGGESGALAALKNAKSPADAAAVWDAQYERSAGTTRQERISAAQSYASGGGYAGPSGYSGSSGNAGSVGGGVQTKGLSTAQYAQALGSLSGIITKVPELNTLLKAAVKSGQTADDFVNSIQNSKWYKTHSDTYRTMFSLQYSNPSEYGQQTKSTTDSVIAQARAMGVHLTAKQAASVAHSVLWSGLDAGATQRAIAGAYIADGGINGTQSGNAATTTQALQQLATAYGVPVTTSWLNSYTQKILAGVESTDGAKSDLIRQASSLYPSIAKQLKGGQSTADVAQPYIAQMSQTLEVPDGQITLSDPTIKRALMYSTADPKTGKASAPSLQPLYTFENSLRQDPRWDKTNNAKQEAFGMLHQLGQSFGFAS